MKKRQGSTLVMVLMIFLVLSILATATLSFMVSENKQSIVHKDSVQAYYIARSGAEAAEAAIMKIYDEADKEIERLKAKINQIKNSNEKDQEDKIRKFQQEIVAQEAKKNTVTEGVTETKSKEIKISNDGSDDLTFNNGGYVEYVRLKKEGDLYIIESKGILGDGYEIVEKVLQNTGFEVEVDVISNIDTVIFSMTNILFENNTQNNVIGSIGTNSSKKDAIKFTSGFNKDITIKIPTGSDPSKVINKPTSNKDRLKVEYIQERTYPLYDFSQLELIKNNKVSDDTFKLSEFLEYNTPSEVVKHKKLEFKDNRATIDSDSIYGDIEMSWDSILTIDASKKDINIWVENFTKVYQIVVKGDHNVNIHIKSSFSTNNSNGTIIKKQGNTNINIYYSGNIFNTNNSKSYLEANLYLNPSDNPVKISNSPIKGNIYIYEGAFSTSGGNPEIIGDIYAEASQIDIPSGNILGDIYISKGNFLKKSGGDVVGNIYINEGYIEMPNGDIKGDVYINKGNFLKKSGGNVLGNIILNEGYVEMPNGNIEGDVYIDKGSFKKESSGDFIGNLYINNGDAILKGSGKLEGSVFTNGKSVILSGAGKVSKGLIYAPNADIELPEGTAIQGAIICNDFKMSGGASIKYVSEYIDSGLIKLPSTTKKVIFKKSYYK